jgi:hypothetical protein
LMAENADLRGRILGFLMGEWSRKDNRQLVGVDLLYAPGGGYRDEEIRKWERADEPDLFAEFVNIEKLVNLIVEIAEGEADAKAPGKHRFIVRTRQHLGNKQSMSFALNPSFVGSGDETALLASGGGGGGGGGGRDQQIIASHAGQLMRINQQMFDGTIRVLGQQTMNLHEQNAALVAENAVLRRELEEARSNKMDRDFQIAMATEKNKRTDLVLGQGLQLAKIVATKWTGTPIQASDSQLVTYLNDLFGSLNQEQLMAHMQLFDMPQKILFLEIKKLIQPPDQAPNGQPNGQPGPR